MWVTFSTLQKVLKWKHTIQYIIYFKYLSIDANSVAACNLNSSSPSVLNVCNIQVYL